uniref:DUF4283 domain-containing protein n=1 Tax=Panagrellus redivivus TaxID=6233 RepID=A0A7E4WA89_PANRE
MTNVTTRVRLRPKSSSFKPNPIAAPAWWMESFVFQPSCKHVTWHQSLFSMMFIRMWGSSLFNDSRVYMHFGNNKMLHSDIMGELYMISFVRLCILFNFDANSIFDLYSEGPFSHDDDFLQLVTYIIPKNRDNSNPFENFGQVQRH